jgi:hypothetical protein
MKLIKLSAMSISPELIGIELERFRLSCLTRVYYLISQDKAKYAKATVREIVVGVSLD